MQCHIDNKHGHHPGHAFKAATEQTSMPALADFLCNPGRNVRHSAVCDGCEKFIYGVRHKCLNCPDWDFCPECIKSAKFIHPAHRFVPIYEPLAEPVSSGNRHYGIFCDGPLCKDKDRLSHIEGVRYKCAVCHDTDFCANCEAHPSNRHNHTHPLIKFKRPVRSVNVTTLNEDRDGRSITRVGDRDPVRPSTSTEAVPTSPSNAATQVQTIVDVKPTEEPQPKTTKDKIEIRDLLSEPVPEKLPVPIPASAKETETEKETEKETDSSQKLNAHFVRDSIADGTKIYAGFQFVQVWTLRNPGPAAWPAGCSVRHVGGDNMLDLDNTRALSQSELAEASESNVVGRSVAPGEEVAFRTVLKAPVREGTAISYWRLKTAEGMPFGHRLWCDIQVTSPPVPTSPLATAPVKLETFSCQAQGEQDALERLRRVHQEMSDKETLSKIEPERLLRIQKVRKAAVERVFEARRKEELALRLKDVPTQEKASEVPIKTETAELPAEKEIIETEAEKASAPEVALHSSGMIFPQLDKESPASSTHEAMNAPPESPRPASVTTATVSDEEFFEDAESVDIISDEEEDGFMTDEEYDILESADESFP
jgi:next-to-BRCA1 protein 1